MIGIFRFRKGSTKVEREFKCVWGRCSLGSAEDEREEEKRRHKTLLEAASLVHMATEAQAACVQLSVNNGVAEVNSCEPTHIRNQSEAVSLFARTIST